MNGIFLLKIYFNEIINKDVDFINLTPCRGSNKQILAFYFIIVICFKREHPIICKIPFINWLVFKRYLYKKLKGEKYEKT